jgi:type I restriction enzyme S subunit
VSKQHPSPLGKLPKNWSVVQLKEITEKIKSGATPRGGDSSYLSSREKFALIRSQNVFDRSFNETGLAFISDKQAGELSGAEVQLGDALLNITGDGITFARATLVPERVLPACVNQHVMLIRSRRDKCVPGFILSYLTHPRIKDYIESFNAGGSRRAITKGNIESFVIPLPPLPEQRAIASVLGSLDDKIELNRRMNETLETLAQSLFKSWFVDACLRQGHCGQVTQSDLPKGWRVESVYTAADVIYGAPFSSAKFNKERIGKPLIRIRDLADEAPEVFTPEQHPKGYLVKPGDIVVGMDGEFRAHLWGGEEALLNQRVCVFAPKPGFSAPFVLNSIVGSLAEVEATETATTVIHIGKNDIDRFKIVVSDEKTLGAYNQAAEPLFKRIVLNKQESRTLAALRDALLPKLLSGELRVPEAQTKLLQNRGNPPQFQSKNNKQ